MPAPTHFLCIPLAGAQLKRSWAAFRADVAGPGRSEVPEGAVRPPGTLHLTLGVMNLGPDTLAEAARVLQSLRPRAIFDELRASRPSATDTVTDTDTSRRESSELAAKTAPSVTLRGLRPMQAPSKTSVLYAPPADDADGGGLLLRWCERLRAPFRERGLMGDDGGRPLLLHATLVNTIYVKRTTTAASASASAAAASAGQRQGGGGSSSKRRERVTMDARPLLERYADFLWAQDLPITRLAICRMGAKPIEGSDGDAAYEVEAETEI